MGKPTKTAELIRKRIQEIPPGEPFTPDEFLSLGTRAAVDQTLSRLIQTQQIMRVARGIYCLPVDGRIGRYGSSEKKVVDLIAKGETLQVHGARAANIMGLSTQVPMSSIYLTSGRSRTLLIRNKTVEFRHASSRKLLLAGRRAGVALTAMWYLGKAEVTPRLVGKIRRKLGAEEFEALKSVINDMPAWMRAAMLVDEQIHKNEQRRKLRESGSESGSTVAPIPPTSLSPLVYIGGLAALNLPSPTGTGDWHLEETFFSQKPPASRSFLFGVGCETDTTSFFEEEGICDDFYDCTEILDKLCIPHEGAVAYAATHARAVADLILGAVLRGESPDYVVLDDWMPGTWDKECVYFLLEEARPLLTGAQKEKLWAWECKNPFDYGNV
ncbi:hypothetical protein SAMN05216296_1981 [Pseudomonas pohangensis]|uniref:Transcriptional regulator, AbiEi antitoxin, Type IV TA system n=2 Tax=Pseudomonas pohangensis TaxID=364197 RepID=A0A1H2G229_9PSED|nr:hypothetical protein SAMN05216296_1981 [Pseudomonas pohangensis]